MRAVGSEVFAMVVAFEYLGLITFVVSTHKIFLYATAGRGVVSLNRKPYLAAIGQFKRTLHQTFAKRTASHNKSSVIILYCSGENLTAARRKLINKDYEGYEAEILERYNHGENFTADSAHINTSEIFKTAGGRTVFGGGGIMPDVFVPSDTSGINKFYLELANASLLNRFAFEYVDLNRDELSKAGDTEELLSMLPSDGVLLSAFASYVKQNGVRLRYYYLNNSRRLIVRQLKALIARDVLGLKAYYEIDNTADTTVLEAIKQIKSGAASFAASE